MGGIATSLAAALVLGAIAVPNMGGCASSSGGDGSGGGGSSSSGIGSLGNVLGTVGQVAGGGRYGEVGCAVGESTGDVVSAASLGPRMNLPWGKPVAITLTAAAMACPRTTG